MGLYARGEAAQPRLSDFQRKSVGGEFGTGGAHGWPKLEDCEFFARDYTVALNESRFEPLALRRPERETVAPWGTTATAITMPGAALSGIGSVTKQVTWNCG